MANIIFPTDTTAVAPASWDLIMIADVSATNVLKECTLWSLTALLSPMRITVPWEQVIDASNYQWMYYYNDTGATITISNVWVVVWVAAAGAGAALSINVYKSSWTEAEWLNTNAVNLFSSAIALTTSYTSLTNVPDTATVESGRYITMRVTASAGATNKASDLQVIITYTY